MRERMVTAQSLERYEAMLQSEEKSYHTIEKYMRDVQTFFDFAGKKSIEK